MAQTLVSNYVHIIFSTKNREAIIDDDLEKELFEFIGTVCKQNECDPVIVGGHVDHIHVLCKLSKKITLVELVKKIKSYSSKWIKTKSEKNSNFYWQDGYGAFSINNDSVQKIALYIANQKKHHETQSFQEEYKHQLKEYDIDFDERYLWT
jgi:putative transposase